MRLTFEYCLNHLYRKEINSLFGEGSIIEVNYIKYSTNAKGLTTNPQECIETYPVGLECLVSESWKWMGCNEKIALTHSIDLK